MAKETIGYVHLEWTCPACNSKNRGLDKVCRNCGAPQPDDVQFEQAAQETLITDEKVVAKAKSGADIHCPFCGTRNPAGATQCSQCMGDLTGGKARQSGQVLGAYKDKAAADVVCAHCGTPNPATALQCQNCGASLAAPKPAAATPAKQTAASARVNPVVLVLAGLALLACGVFVFLSLRTEEIVGRVADVSWRTNVVVQQLGPVQREAWRADVPNDGRLLSCRQEVRRTQDEPAPNSERVCGTPYTVDTGSGVGQVVQDCQYLVYDDLCDYSVNEWQEIDVATLTGNDFQPRPPQLSLAADQRLGEASATYEVTFDADGQTYTYSPNDANEYARFVVGSSWVLEVNSFNAVLSVSPR